MAGVKGRSGRKPNERFMREALILELNSMGADRQGYRRIMAVLLDKAKHGDLGAIKEVLDRIDGKVPQLVGGDDETDPISLIVTGVPRAHE